MGIETLILVIGAILVVVWCETAGAVRRSR